MTEKNTLNIETTESEYLPREVLETLQEHAEDPDRAAWLLGSRVAAQSPSVHTASSLLKAYHEALGEFPEEEIDGDCEDAVRAALVEVARKIRGAVTIEGAPVDLLDVWEQAQLEEAEVRLREGGEGEEARAPLLLGRSRGGGGRQAWLPRELNLGTDWLALFEGEDVILLEDATKLRFPDVRERVRPLETRLDAHSVETFLSRLFGAWEASSKRSLGEDLTRSTVQRAWEWKEEDPSTLFWQVFEQRLGDYLDR